MISIVLRSAFLQISLTWNLGGDAKPQEGGGSGGALPYLTYGTIRASQRFRKSSLKYHLEGPVLRIIRAVTEWEAVHGVNEAFRGRTETCVRVLKPGTRRVLRKAHDQFTTPHLHPRGCRRLELVRFCLQSKLYWRFFLAPKVWRGR